MASAPLPTVEVNASWRGLILLGNIQTEQELATLIAEVIPCFVEVFTQKGGSPLFSSLLRDLSRMADLYSEVLRMPGMVPTDRARAEKEINVLKTCVRELSGCWGTVPPASSIPLHVAKSAVTQINRFMHGMIMLTDVMEAQQRRQLLARILQAAQAVQLLREARSPESLQRAAPIFNSYFDALYGSLGQRIEALTQMGEQQHRMRTAQMMEGVQHARYRLFSAMENYSGDPHNIEADVEVEQETQRLSKALEELVALLTTGVKAAGALDHEVIERSLAALQEAVDAQSPGGVAAAARDLVEEVKKLEARPGPPSEPDQDASGPLRDATDRLKEQLQLLLQATKANLNQPSPDNHDRFLQRLEQVQREAEYDTISTTLLSSGIIDAAAQVSAQLNQLFHT